MRRAILLLIPVLASCSSAPVAVWRTITPRPPRDQNYGRVPSDRDPILVSSPSRAFQMWINPSVPSGAGAGTYRLSVAGQAAWERKLPFTLVDAEVTDTGMTVGYGYSNGEWGPGDIVIAAIDAEGKIRFEDRIPGVSAPSCGGSGGPRAHGIILDHGNDRFIARVGQGYGEEWRFYSLSTGKLTKKVTPGSIKGSGRWSIFDVQPILGSRSFVINWESEDYSGPMGQAFSVVDDEGHSFWERLLPDDFSSAKEPRDYEIRSEARQHGMILGLGPVGRFEVRYVKAGQRVTLQATDGSGGPSVREISRKPYVAPAAPAPFTAPPISLALARSFVVPTAEEASPEVREIGEFQFWGENVVFIRGKQEKSICVADRQGRLVREIALPKEARGAESALYLSQISGSQFLLASTISEGKDVGWAWRIDAGSGTVDTLPDFQSFWIQSMAALPDGRFATLSSEIDDDDVNWTNDYLTLYSPEGRKLWQKSSEEYRGGQSEVSDMADVTVNRHGQIVVLSNIDDRIQIFDAEGKFRKFIDLEKKWGRSSMPDHLTCLPDGGYWIYDIGEPKPFLRLKADGSIASGVALKFASGKAFYTQEAVAADAQGQPWVSNEAGLHRIAPNGRVVETIGRAPRLAGLGTIAQLHVAVDGAIYALDDETKAVHVFDAGGRPRFVAAPKASEFEDRDNTSLDVTASGDIFVSGSMGEDLHFFPNGKRSGNVSYPRGSAPAGPFAMKPTYRWWGSTLIDESSKAVGTLSRWPDQAWLHGGPSALAPDGRLMAFGASELAGRRRLAFYGPSGKPEGQVPVAESMPDVYGSAYDGKNAYFVTKEGLVAIDRSGKVLWAYRPVGFGIEWEVFASRGKLALFDGKRTVQWVEVPAR